jgi:hypothetical protein
VINKNNELDGACSTYGREEMCIQVLVGEPVERDHSENIDVHEKILLKCIFKSGIGTWIVLIWLRIGAGGNLCKCCNKLSSSTKYREFLDQL